MHYNLILFHLHPDVRSPGAVAFVVGSGALSIDGVDDVTEVTLIAGGTAGVSAIENYNYQMWRSFGSLCCKHEARSV